MQGRYDVEIIFLGRHHNQIGPFKGRKEAMEYARRYLAGITNNRESYSARITRTYRGREFFVHSFSVS